MNEINITSAQYVNDLDGNRNHIKVIYGDGTSLRVPESAGNRHYDEIMQQVEAGTLTIQEAD